jgi:ATP-binding cassette, subfamily C, bacterial CydC
VRVQRETMRPALRLLGPHRRLVKWAVGASVAHEALLVAAAGVSAYLVGFALTGAPLAQLVPWFIGLVVIAPLIVLLSAMSGYVAHKMSFDSHDDIRRALFDTFERLAPAYFLRRRSGDATAVASSDVELVELYTAHHLPARVVASVVPGCAIIGLGLFHPVLVAAVAPVLVLIATVPGWLRARAAAQGQEILKRDGALSADLVDSVQGLREVAAFGAQRLQLRRIEVNAGALGTARVAHGRRGGIEKALTDALASLGVIAVLGVAAILVQRGALAPSAYPPAVVLATAAFVPLGKLRGVGREMNRVAAAADRITALLGEPSTVTDPPGCVRAQVVEPRVRFEHVSFRYAAELPLALADVSFTVELGETVALVGHSGAGKSTCVNLLLRSWDPVAGMVSIGGHDLRRIPLVQLPELVTLVPQDVYLFNDDVWGNIRIGCPHATDAQVKAAAAAAQASEFIEALPRGYRTQLGERGARLSGGQRQRLAIARAIVSPAPILVMDEAVSNLDTESELALHQALTRLGGQRTLLIIAHRPATIRTATRIVVMREGRVVEQGPYNDLLAANGPFAQLIHPASRH